MGSSPANAYETGTLICQRIGELAAETLAAKQTGTDLEIHLAALNQPFELDAERERKLVANLVVIIYRNELLAAMTPVDAYMVFRSDCLRGKGFDD